MVHNKWLSSSVLTAVSALLNEHHRLTAEYVYFSTPVSLLQKITGPPLSKEDEQIRVCQGAKTLNAW